MVEHLRFRGLGLAAACTVLLGLTAIPVASASPITYSPTTVVIPSSVVSAQLRSVSANGATYTFRRATGPLARLRKGSVMLLQGLAVRDVTGVSKKSSGLVVVTTPAAITDLIRNGTLTWNKPVGFTHAYALGGAAVPIEPARDSSASSRFGLDALGASGVTLKGKTKSYSYSVSFKPSGKAVTVDITIGKSSPIDMSVKISGTLDNLSSGGSIAVHGSQLQAARMLASGLKGKFTISYSFKPISGFGLGQAGGIKITLPAELTIPLPIDGIPFFLGIKTAFFASVGFNGFDEEVTGSYTMNFNGKGGFSTSSSGATTALGALQSLGKIILNAANAVSKPAISVIFGAQVPQLELGLGVKGLNVAGFVTLVAQTGMKDVSGGCDARGFEMLGSAGVEGNFFGLSASSSATIFDKKIQTSYPRGCGTFF